MKTYPHFCLYLVTRWRFGVDKSCNENWTMHFEAKAAELLLSAYISYLLTVEMFCRLDICVQNLPGGSCLLQRRRFVQRLLKNLNMSHFPWSTTFPFLPFSHYVTQSLRFTHAWLIDWLIDWLTEKAGSDATTILIQTLRVFLVLQANVEVVFWYRPRPLPSTPASN
jgi:hypothetical protein